MFSLTKLLPDRLAARRVPLASPSLKNPEQTGHDHRLRFPYLVIGAGVSGAAAAWELAALGSTILLEMEDQPGYHSSGRSAALYTPNYGPAAVRQICQVAGVFFNAPPPGFTEHPLLTPRGALTLGIDDPEGDDERC